MSEKITFEEAEKELQAIIEKLENENVSFSESQNLYERGSFLVKNCLTELEDIKGKISIIKKELDQFIEEKFE